MSFNNLTQFVNAYSVLSHSARLQVVKAYASEGWIFFFDFYPEPRSFFLVSRPEFGFSFERQSGVVPVSHPLQLYLKAHFVGHDLLQVRSDESSKSVIFIFEIPDLEMALSVDGDILSTLLKVPGRKAFSCRVQLGYWPKNQPEGGSQKPVEGNLRSVKQEKLLENIKADAARAQVWLDLWNPVCRSLQADPTLWLRPLDWEPRERAILDKEIAEGQLPPLGTDTGVALDKLFRLRRKMERRLAGALKRLNEVQESSPRQEPRNLSQGAIPLPAAVDARPQKKPGLWVLVRPDLWARVGRSASENDELFRQARDRDLWFHVHGEAGSHVWIPRGQPGFGAKSEASEALKVLGCQLALMNSPAKKSGRAEVDVTERRHLRRIRNAVGKVEIIRSETHFVKLDESLRDRLFKKTLPE